MSASTSPKTVQGIIERKPYLTWYVADPKQLSDASVLEHVLNYGDWEDVQHFIQIKGLEETAQLFARHAKQTRCNYLPEIKAYFTKYFQKHAASYSDQ
jgi:hypothetical protein